MKYTLIVMWVFAGWFTLTAAYAGQPADYVFVNAKVYTQDPARPWAEAVAVAGDTLVAVGGNRAVKKLAGPSTRVIDLGGRMLMPGFVDAHNHFLAGAVPKRGVKLNGAKDKAELLRRVTEYVRANPGRPYFMGYGWTYPMMGADLGSRQELDAIASDKPLLLFNEDTHSVWFNTKAMRMGGVAESAPDPTPASKYTRNPDGSLAGIAVEPEAWQGMALASGLITGKDTLREIVRAIFPMLPKAGITAFYDMGIWAPDLPRGNAGLELLREMENVGNLPCRVAAVYGVRDAGLSPVEQVGILKAWRTAYNSPLIQVNGLKIWADGTPDTHTAVQLTPYADAPGTQGESPWTKEVLAKWIAQAYAEGFDVHIHAMGDGSVRRALDAFESVRRLPGAAQRRSALHHINVIHPDDLPRFKRLGIGGNATLEWLVTYWDGAKTLLGEERRAKEWDVWKKLIDQGVNVSFGSDIPGTDPDELAPLYQMQIAATQRIPTAPELPPPPKDRIPTLRQMLHGYTLAGARQMRLDDKIGSIKTGKRADLIVLERNLFEVPAGELASVKVLLTMMGGKITHLDSGGGLAGLQ